MEKLELYLDQVCRSIGGPRELRDHVRQELREHLLDAMAQHKAAGLSDDMALAKALEEFGKPEEVRTELEATYGQRKMMSLVIDKALDWKEKTMRAKWLWVTWAYVGLGLVIAMEALFITFNVIFIVPKFQKLMSEGIIDPAIVNDEGARWMLNCLLEIHYIAGNYTLFLVVVPAIAWGLFEWRVASENKPFIRLSALGTVAVALMSVVILMSGSLVVLFCLGVPAIGRMTRPWTVERVREVETRIKGFETSIEAGRKKGKLTAEQAAGYREELRAEATGLGTALTLLSLGPAMPALADPAGSPSAGDLREHLKATEASMREVHKAIDALDLTRLEMELVTMRKAFEPIRKASTRPAP